MRSFRSPSSGQGRRWPARVYGVGTEPDPRFSMANERTFLAWIRTALALLAAGAAVDALDLSIPDAAQRFIAGVLALTSLLAAVQAWRGWLRTERALREDKPLPHAPAAVPVVLGVSLVAVCLLAVVVL